jgi:hypothetical protein
MKKSIIWQQYDSSKNINGFIIFHEKYIFQLQECYVIPVDFSRLLRSGYTKQALANFFAWM